MKESENYQNIHNTPPGPPHRGGGGRRPERVSLSEHFVLSEFTRSAMAEKRGIRNEPNLMQIANLKRLCEEVLEPLRRKFGKPIRINSGFRCEALNRAVGGAAKSYHLQGRAADIPMVPGWLAYIRDHLPHKELINEGTWIHVAV